MNIRLQYFASLKDHSGCSEEVFQSQATDLKELYAELQNKYHFPLSTQQLKAVVNENFVSWDTALSENDEVVFIPPVGGG